MIRQDVLRSGGGSHKIFLKKLGASGGAARNWWQQVSLYHRSLLALEKRQFAASNFRLIIAVSAEVKRELIEAYGLPENKIVVLYNGVDLVRFTPALRERWRAAVRAELGIPREAEVVLFVGNGFYRKGLDRLLAAWRSPELKTAFLIIVGDDARMRGYRHWAEREAPGRIIFAGRQQTVERFYGAADVLALPALQEAFGNVVLEALAAGVTPVVSRQVGAAELLTGGMPECVVRDPDCAGELSGKLAAALRRCRRPEQAARARELAEAHSWENHFKGLEKCLASVARQKRAREIPEFVQERDGAYAMWVDKRLAASGFAALLRRPDDLLALPACEVIKDERKVKIGRLELTAGGHTKTIYVKRYKAFSWRYKVGSLFMRSRGAAALEGGGILARAEIAAVPAVAAVEWRRRGILEGDAFISEEIAGGWTADKYWRQCLAPIAGRVGLQRRRGFIERLASLLSELHEKRIYHNDLKDANIVAASDESGAEKLFLLDVEGVRRCWYISRRRRIKNLVQLNRTLGAFVRQPEKLFFLRMYLGPSTAGPLVRRTWVRRILRATRRADRLFLARLQRHHRAGEIYPDSMNRASS
jgi:UDP-glucose:(heptosyl)LPS alpha-1,3-glucosyltransferase